MTKTLPSIIVIWTSIADADVSVGPLSSYINGTLSFLTDAQNLSMFLWSSHTGEISSYSFAFSLSHPNYGQGAAILDALASLKALLKNM